MKPVSYLSIPLTQQFQVGLIDFVLGDEALFEYNFSLGGKKAKLSPANTF